MTKLVEDNTAKKRKFRGALGIRENSKLKLDPNKEYRWVVTNYANAVDAEERVEKFIDQGWDVVYSTDRPQDERSFAPDNDSKNSDRLKPVTKRDKLYNKVLMCCSKEQRQLNETAKAQRDDAELRRSQKNVSNRGGNVTMTGQDVDLNNIGD